MKAVLVGSDLMYRQDGILVPIEINTNVGVDYNNMKETEENTWGNLSDFSNFISSHGINKIYLEGFPLYHIKSFIERAVGPGILVEYIEPDGTSVLDGHTVEDADDTLLCRSIYSDEALVDSFARDKIAFLDLVKNKDYGTDYILKTEEGYQGTINFFPDNGNYPNFIIKYRYPQYDVNQYPKLCKFSTMEELLDYVENNLKVGYFVSPYYFNSSKLISVREDKSDRRIQLFRNWSLFVGTEPDELVSVDLGTYTKVGANIDDSKVIYNENHELNQKCVNMFMTKMATLNPIADILVEKTDLVLMEDDTWKEAASLEVGDLVKSLQVPTSGDVDIHFHIGDYNIPFGELEESSSFISASIQLFEEVHAFNNNVSMVFTDGTDWWDTERSSYLVLDPEDETVMFANVGDLHVGQQVILLDINDLQEPKYVLKTIQTLEQNREFVEGYKLTVEGSHIFVTRAAEDRSGYASIEHNGSGTFTKRLWFSTAASCSAWGNSSPLVGGKTTGRTTDDCPERVANWEAALTSVQPTWTRQCTAGSGGTINGAVWAMSGSGYTKPPAASFKVKVVQRGTEASITGAYYMDLYVYKSW